MNKKKLFTMILAGLLALLLIATMVAGMLPSLVNAESVSELKQQLDKLKEDKEALDSEIKGLRGQLSDNLDSMEKIVAQKNTIDQEIFALYEQTTNLNDQIATYSLLIADKQDELDEAQAHLDELNRKNKERIRTMEEDGSLSYWSVLFKANDFSDLLDRLNMVEEIAASDQRRLKEMSEAAKVVAEAKASLEEERAALEVSKEELKAAQETLEIRRAEADKLLADLVATGEEYEKLLEAAEENAADLSTEIKDAQKEYDDAKYQQWLSTSVPPTTASSSSSTTTEAPVVNGLKWVMPCSYVKFTSPYGWRIHPIYGYRKFHYGVDLAGASGTPIVATRAGVVETTSYDSSSGYYVKIDHQDGFASKYLHLTRYIVKPGQSVSAGEVIGYMGSTGASTGPHLHFAIMYNGSHVNPAAYIKF